MPITIYCDGAVTKQGLGGWAYVIPELDVEKFGAVEGSTNNTMEMQAAIEAMMAYPTQDLLIISDSEYLVQGSTSWAYGWSVSGWITSSGKPVSNKEMWEAILRLKKDRKVGFKWVKGHSTNEGNNRADELAQAACRPKKNWGTHRHKETGEQINVIRQQKCVTPYGEYMVVLQSQDGWWNVVSKHDFKEKFEKIPDEEGSDQGSS